MSRGYTGCCKKKDEDPETVVYVYSGANWNDPDYDKDAEHACDGEIRIRKSIVNQPRRKCKERKEYVYWLSQALEEEAATVTRPCKNAFFRNNYKVDYIALRCLYKIFQRVYYDGIFPEQEWFIQ
jgi:DNA-directed RNA polymerase subunit M/transcription elongation factor TFIIS